MCHRLYNSALCRLPSKFIFIHLERAAYLNQTILVQTFKHQKTGHFLLLGINSHCCCVTVLSQPCYCWMSQRQRPWPGSHALWCRFPRPSLCRLRPVCQSESPHNLLPLALTTQLLARADYHSSGQGSTRQMVVWLSCSLALPDTPLKPASCLGSTGKPSHKGEPGRHARWNQTEERGHPGALCSFPSDGVSGFI